MTKSMMTRLAIVGLALLALVLAAVRPWDNNGAATTAQTATEGTIALASGSEDSANSDGALPRVTDDTAAATADDDADAVEGISQTAERASNSALLAQDDAAANDEHVTLTLLHNNDGESKLLANADGGYPGIARFAQAWVDLGQSTDADILLRVSSGDNFLASKEFSAGLALDGEPLYDALALRGLYEAMSFGNHDFDFGPDVAARFVEDVQIDAGDQPAPFVAVNIDVNGEPALESLVEQGLIVPSVVYTDVASGHDIGIIGALTPRLANISSPRNVNVDANIAAAVNAEAARLAEQGVTRIVLVSHLQGLGEDRDLVPQLQGVDIVVAGGGDELLKNAGDTCQPGEDAVEPYPLLLEDADGIEVPVVTAPGGYRCIGRLDVTFDGDGQIVEVSGESIGVPLDGAQEAFSLARVEDPLRAALAELDAEVLGSSDVDLDGRRTSVRTGPSNVGELLADSLLAAGQAAPDFGGNAPTVAIQNGGGIRNDSVISAGDITAADTFDIAPFANFVVTGDISREQFKDLLEVAVAGLPDAEGTFPQIAGFTMDVDASRGPRAVDSDGDCAVVFDLGSRVRTVTLDDGTEIVRDGAVVPGDDLTLATIDFLANGGDCYPLSDLEFTKVGASYQQALAQFITDDLDGSITAADYPATGSRIVVSGLDANGLPVDDASDDASASDDDDAHDAAPDDTVDTDEDADSSDAALADDADELARTGASNTWLGLIIALTAAVAGVLVAAEAQRAGRISLTNRLTATRAWIPESDNDEI